MQRRRARGLTLIESMVAMAVVLIATVGMMGLHTQGQKWNSDALRMTRATAIALDLLSQIQTWDYTDVRLANTHTSNDAILGDPAFRLEAATAIDPVASGFVDHANADLATGTWNGLPAAEVTDLGYERFWSVASAGDTNGNGVEDGKRIAVFVRWKSGGAYRRIVLYDVLPNKADAAW